MIISTTDLIPGKRVVKILGVVRGNTVRTKHFGKDIVASLTHIIGGEIKTYTDMMSQAREEAQNRMINEAISLNADAVINIRFMTSSVMGGAAEMLAYGTAVKLG